MLMRTLLYVPANRANMVARAHETPADVIILDLEDSVPPAEKAAARSGLAGVIASLKAAGRNVYVRVNHFETGLTTDDLTAAVCPQLDGIAFPKADSAAEVCQLDELIREAEGRQGISFGAIALIPHIESARGVLHCEAISTAAKRVAGIGLSAFDFVADLGVDRTKEGRELDFARQMIVHCCAAARLQALDAPYGDFRDEAGLRAETEYVKSIGFKGKHLIHPAQVAVVNSVYTPDQERVETARRILAAFDEAVARGEASVQVDGTMVDTAVARRARDLVSFADAIAQTTA